MELNGPGVTALVKKFGSSVVLSAVKSTGVALNLRKVKELADVGSLVCTKVNVYPVPPMSIICVILASAVLIIPTLVPLTP